jgi:hypothetical protein
MSASLGQDECLEDELRVHRLNVVKSAGRNLYSYVSARNSLGFTMNIDIPIFESQSGRDRKNALRDDAGTGEQDRLARRNG